MSDIYGDCILHRLDTGRIEILQSDPTVLISVQLLNEIEAGHEADVDLANGVLTIHGTNRVVAYRLGQYQPDMTDHRCVVADRCSDAPPQ